MNKYLKTFNYILRHKWFVAIECFKRKQYLLGIIHDWSKLLPSEFIPYTNYFFGEKNDENKKKFDFAWLLHQRRNKHHWQWWILREDEGKEKVMEMSIKYRVEMLCDWIGAGRAINGFVDIKEWYEKNKNKITIAEETKKWVEECIK